MPVTPEQLEEMSVLELVELKKALDALPCEVVLPKEWGDYFQRRGPLTWQGDEIRRYVRSHFPTRALLELKTTLPAIYRPHERHVVLMKTISRQGSSFLHFSQLFPGERIQLQRPVCDRRRGSLALRRACRCSPRCSAG